jgi:hypothetical protein
MLIADPYETWNDADIPPGGFEVLDLVIRPPEDEKCYGWSNNFLLAQAGAPAPVGEVSVLEARPVSCSDSREGGRTQFSARGQNL